MKKLAMALVLMGVALVACNKQTTDRQKSDSSRSREKAPVTDTKPLDGDDLDKRWPKDKDETTNSHTMNAILKDSTGDEAVDNFLYPGQYDWEKSDSTIATLHFSKESPKLLNGGYSYGCSDCVHSDSFPDAQKSEELDIVYNTRSTEFLIKTYARFGDGLGNPSTPPALKSSVKFKPPTVHGKIRTEIIESIIERREIKLLHCYKQRMLRLKGEVLTMTVAWSIDKDGKGYDHRIIQASSKDTDLENCVINVLSSAKFPKPKDKKPVHVKYPIEFRFQ